MESIILTGKNFWSHPMLENTLNKLLFITYVPTTAVIN